MSLRVQVKKVKFEDKDMYMIFDMKSIDKFKSITNKSILKSIDDMINGNIDEMTLYYMICSCLRDEIGGEPVGDLGEDFNPIAIVSEYGKQLATVLIGSMPKNNGNYGKKKRARI